MRLALTLATVLALASGCSSNDPTTCDDAGPPVVEDVTVGTGSATANTSSTVTVRYVGTLLDGTEFDSSEGATFSLTRTILGFRIGIGGGAAVGLDSIPPMRIGGRRTITIPPNYGYGAFPPSSAIPACAALRFDVTLLDIR